MHSVFRVLSHPFSIAESNFDANGLLREVWYMYENTVDDFEEIDEVIVDAWHVIQTLSVPVNFSKNYLQKLTTYFKVKLYHHGG